MAPRIVARQLAHPRGIGGAIVRLLMNRGNKRLNGLALDLMDVRPDDRVLEVGFGGGPVLDQVITQARFFCGVDRSEDAVAAANRRFAAWVERERAEFKIGSVERLPIASATFNKAVTVNTVYFWKSLEAGLGEIRRSLAPNGRLVIGFVPKLRMERMNMPADIFTARTPDEIRSAAKSTGFSSVEIEAPWGEDHPMAAVCHVRG